MPPGVYTPAFHPKAKLNVVPTLSGDLAGLLAWPLLNTFPMILLNKSTVV